MTRKRRRLILLLACGIGLGIATALVLTAFRDNLVFSCRRRSWRRTRRRPAATSAWAGWVEQGSVHRTTVDGHPAAAFTVTDGGATVKVTYVGILPDLSARARAWWRSAPCCPTARSAPPRCSPSTTRPICRRMWSRR